MSPILGIIASSMKGESNSYESIATVSVGSGGSSTVTFSSIPSTYQHLQVRAISRTTGADASYQHLTYQFNSDTGSNYFSHGLYGTGSSVFAHADGSLSATPLSYNLPTTSQTASTFAGGVIDVLDYANTNKYKVVRALGGFDANGSGALGIYSANWNSTSAINSITFKVYQGSNFAQYTSFALYGIKG